MKNSPFLLLACVIMVGLVGCDDSGLGGGLPPGDSFSPGDEMVPPNMDPAITVGTELHIYFARIYVPDHADYTGGLTNNERQASGRMCTRVTAVDDGYPTNTETSITTQTKVSSGIAGTDIYVNGSDGSANPIDESTTPALTPAEVSDATQNLWLSRLTPQIRGHGYTTEAALTFDTQQGFTPPDQSMARLLFFDVRRSDDGLWQGWSSDGSIAGAQSFIGKVHTYFLNAPYDSSFFMDTTRFKENHNEPGSGCTNFTDSTQCQISGCSWDFGTNICNLPNLVIDLVWRETLTVGPPELKGDVIHAVKMEYLLNGTLKSVFEYIIKDQISLTTELDFINGCAPVTPYNYTSGPCATGMLYHHIATFDTAPCGF